LSLVETIEEKTEVIRPEDGKAVNCVKCNELYNSAMPAISRDDNKTEVCPNCGIREAGIAVIIDPNKETLKLIKNVDIKKQI
jgi:RNase P subunit RPR2